MACMYCVLLNQLKQDSYVYIDLLNHFVIIVWHLYMHEHVYAFIKIISNQYFIIDI